MVTLRTKDTSKNPDDPSKRRLRYIIAPVVAALVVVYFIYHIFQGERGVLSWLRLRQKIAEDEKVMMDLEKQKNILERQVYLLRPDSLDKDMLEERVRIILNFGHPDEVVIYDGTIHQKKKK